MARLFPRDRRRGARIPMFISLHTQRRMQKLRTEYETYCASRGCKVTVAEGKFAPGFRITYEDGYWFEFQHDPLVFEVTGKPNDPLKVKQETRDRL